MAYWDGSRWTKEPVAAPAARDPLDALRVVAALVLLVMGTSFQLANFGSARAVSPVLRTTPGSAPVGSKVSISGSYFPSKTKVQLTWDGSPDGMPSATVNGRGVFSVSMKVPKAKVGSHLISALGTPAGGGRKGAPTTTAPLEASTSFSVTSAAPPEPTPEPTATSGPTSEPTARPAPTITPTPDTPATQAPAATSVPTTAPTATPRATTPKLLFGLGPQIEGARSAPISQQAPIHLLSSWYNGPGDLSWITDAWHRSIYDSAYAAGYSLHLITWSDLPETTFAASTGTVCGRAYPLSDRWRDDMVQLAKAFGGPASGPPLYVTLFTEFQTYPCVDNAWSPNAQTTRYYQALIAQYEAGLAIFHQYAPNARVSLGWGGWQTRWDDASIGGGSSMIPYFATTMLDSDFQSFQAMAGDSNVTDIRSMTRTLGAYGSVMIAHHMPDGDTNSSSTVDATFYNDVEALLTTESVGDLVGRGLFAWSFVSDKPMRDSPAIFALVQAGVTTFGR
jgi:hypothetical protein